MPGIYWQNVITLGLLVIQKKLFKGFHIFDPNQKKLFKDFYIFDHCGLESRSMSFIGGNYIAFHARYLLPNIISLGLLVIQKKLLKGFHIFDPCDLESRSMLFI